MIGGSAFAEVFGAAAAGSADALTHIVRAAIRNGFSPILCRPGTKEPLCVLSDAAAKKANDAAQAAAAAGGMARVDRVRHACGLKHVLDDPAKVKPIVDRLVAIHGPALNLAIHLGRSGLVAVDVDTPDERTAFMDQFARGVGVFAPGITVESPGRYDPAAETWVHWGGGHWFFELPEGAEPPAGKVLKGPGGWAAMWGESYVLVPPSVRPEGAYRLVGAPTTLPDWLGTAIWSRPVIERVVWDGAGENGIDQWSTASSWASMLQPAGWTQAGVDGCGCDIWTAPGDHSSPKSATAHEGDCALGVVRGGGVLHSWTDHPGVVVNEGGNISKLDFVAQIWHGGDVGAAMGALGMTTPPPPTVEFVPAADPPALGATFPGLVAAGPAPALAAVPVLVGRHLALIQASSIPPAAARWLWEDGGDGFSAQWIPIGGITLLAGREGIGKSTILARLIAGVTTGTLPGDFYGQPKSVILSAGEDAWAQTIIPRLLAAGADLARVFRVDVTNDGLPGTLELPVDNSALEQACLYYDVGLIGLDPLMTIIGGRLDTHKDGDVRKALQPLADLAERVQAGVVGLIHQNKAATGDLLTKMMGSRAFSAVARSVLFASAEPTEPAEGDAPHQLVMAAESFLLGQIKSNLGPKAQVTIRYQIDGVTVAHDAQLGKAVNSSRIRDVGTVGQRIEDLLNRPKVDGRSTKPAPGRDAVQEWLVTYLEEQGSPVPAGEVKEAAELAEHSWTVVKRVAVSAQIVRTGSGSSVFWSAPGSE